MPVTTILSDGVFAATRSYALRGTLLSKAAMENLAEAKGLDDLVTRLKATIYDEAVSKISRPLAAYKVELAAREHLSKIHFDLMKTSPDNEVLSTYYLRYITGNLKSVLKGRALGKPFESQLRYIDLYAEELVGRRDLVTRALSADSLENAVTLLEKSEFVDEVSGAVKSYKEGQRLEIFDLYLDRAFFKRLQMAYSAKEKNQLAKRIKNRKLLLSLISVDVDAYNVLTTVRAKSWGLPIAQTRSLLIQPGFDIPAKILERMVTLENPTDAVRLLAQTTYRKMVSSTTQGQALISSLEESFRMLGYERADNPFLWEVMSDSLPLALIKLKEMETRNIAALAFGVEQGMNPRELASKLQMPRR